MKPDLSVSPSLPATPGAVLLSWPLLAFVGAFALTFFSRLAHAMLKDGDTYWHLAAGRWILQHADVPNVDPFSYTARGTPWTAHEWLSEVVIAQAFAWGGWGGLVIMTGLAFGLTVAIILRFLLRRMEPIHALGLAAMAAVLAISHLLARPHVLAWPFIVGWLAALVNAAEDGRAPPWWLLALMAVWANLHGSFTLGLAMAVAMAVEAVWLAPAVQRMAVARRWGLFLIAAAAATLATPYGLQGWAFTLHVMNLKYSLSVIKEWQSLNFQTFQAFEVWLLLALGLALTGRFRLPLMRVLLLLGLTHLALKHGRYASIMGLLSPMLIASGMAKSLRAVSHGEDVAWLDRWFTRLAGPQNRWAGLLVVGMVVSGVAAVSVAKPIAVAKTSTPEAAVRAARAAGLHEGVLNSYHYGGYLIEQGIPVFIDGRADLYGDAFVKTFVQAVQLHVPGALQTLLEKHRIQWTVLNVGTPAVALLDALPGWERVHADELAVVHRRTSASPR